MVTNERRGTGMYHVHNNIIMICVSLGTYFKIMRKNNREFEDRTTDASNSDK